MNVIRLRKILGMLRAAGRSEEIALHFEEG